MYLLSVKVGTCLGESWAGHTVAAPAFSHPTLDVAQISSLQVFESEVVKSLGRSSDDVRDREARILERLCNSSPSGAHGDLPLRETPFHPIREIPFLDSNTTVGSAENERGRLAYWRPLSFSYRLTLPVTRPARLRDDGPSKWPS
jgi:hypothetical protein